MKSMSCQFLAQSRLFYVFDDKHLDGRFLAKQFQAKPVEDFIESRARLSHWRMDPIPRSG